MEGHGEREAGIRRRRKCHSACVQPPPIGARVEARLAWPEPASSSGHVCKPSRSSDPRVVFPVPRFYTHRSSAVTPPTVTVSFTWCRFFTPVIRRCRGTSAAFT